MNSSISRKLILIIKEEEEIKIFVAHISQDNFINLEFRFIALMNQIIRSLNY